MKMKNFLILYQWIIRLAHAFEPWLGAVLITAPVRDNDVEVLLRGPPSGAAIVKAGAAKLFGIEFRTKDLITYPFAD